MKYLISTIAILVLASAVFYYSFLIQKTEPKITNNTNLIRLDFEHPNRTQMEYFLNNYKEVIHPIKVDWRKWEKEDLIEQRYAFITDESQTSLYLIFCKTQTDAITVGEANFSLKTDFSSWSVNGAALFVISSEDKFAVADLLSHFAGEE